MYVFIDEEGNYTDPPEGFDFEAGPNAVLNKRLVLGRTDPVCTWTETEECYDTSCGKAFCMIDGSPKENDMLFCCYCGKQLQEKRMK